MGSLCTSATQPLPNGSRKDPLIFKGESNKIQYEILSSNIASEKVDVLVNPAGTKLQTLSQSIADKGGEKLTEEINKYMVGKETLTAGEVVVTEGGKLHTKHVVHVVLPVWRGGTEQESDQFVLGIKNALVKANELGAKTVAIPAIGGAGVASLPKEDIAKGLITAFVAYSKETGEQSIETVRIFSTDQPLIKNLQETAQLALLPIKADTESVVHPNQNGALHTEKPKSQSPRESNDYSAVQETRSTQSAAIDEPKEHVEAHHNKEQSKEEHHESEEQKVGENHKHEEQVAHETKHQVQEEVVKEETEHPVVQNEHHAVQNEHHAVQNEHPAVQNEHQDLDVQIEQPANQEVSNDGNAQENQHHEEKVSEEVSH